MFVESELPKGATGVILEEGKSPRWTSPPAREVDKEYGGDGNPTREVFPTSERATKAEELFPKSDETTPVAPIELFPEENDEGGRNVAIKPSGGV